MQKLNRYNTLVKNGKQNPLPAYTEEQLKQFCANILQNSIQPHPVNLLCPKCNTQLYDSKPGVFLALPQIMFEVECSCGFQGRRF